MKILKPLIKKITNHPRFRMMISWIFADYIRFVHWTGRWKYMGYENMEKFLKDEKPIIASVWHGRLMMMPYAWTGKESLNVLVSMHRDGQLIGDILKEFNMKTIEGSTSRGGAKAVRKILKLLRQGSSVGLTPDGPRGPRMRMGNSLLYFARTSDVPIIPVAFSAKWAKQFKSWDSFLFAFPFSKGVFMIGEPLEVPKWTDDVEMERLRETFEKRMIFLTAEADRIMGREPTSPAEYPLMSKEAKKAQAQKDNAPDVGNTKDKNIKDENTKHNQGNESAENNENQS